MGKNRRSTTLISLGVLELSVKDAEPFGCVHGVLRLIGGIDERTAGREELHRVEMLGEVGLLDRVDGGDGLGDFFVAGVGAVRNVTGGGEVIFMRLLFLLRERSKIFGVLTFLGFIGTELFEGGLDFIALHVLRGDRVNFFEVFVFHLREIGDRGENRVGERDVGHGRVKTRSFFKEGLIGVFNGGFFSARGRKTRAAGKGKNGAKRSGKEGVAKRDHVSLILAKD